MAEKALEVVKNELRDKYAAVMIELVICAIKGQVPDQELLQDVDLTELYKVCNRHNLTACAAYALESAGISARKFSQAKEKAIRKNILMDSERRIIFQHFEEHKIWYLPLKGVLLKEWYPKSGMRQMSDNDILCDETKVNEIKEIFEECGYTCERMGIGVHDIYKKKPLYHFEIHRSLFSNLFEGPFFPYYKDVKERLIKTEGTEYGYHFRDEDYYLYMLAHEYKHFSRGGTGVRSLVDTYIILNRFRDSYDWDYLAEELEKLELTEFELRNRLLVEKLFAREPLAQDEQEYLNYYIHSGTYGTLENAVNIAFEKYGKGSKLRFVLFRIFPPPRLLRGAAPWVEKSPILIPAAWCYRLFRGMTSGRKKVANEMKYLINKKDNNSKE